MASLHCLDHFTNSQTVGRLEVGYLQATCCKELCIPKNVMFFLWKQFTENNCQTWSVNLANSIKGQHHQFEDCYLRLLAKRDKSAEAIELSCNLHNATGTSILWIAFSQRLNVNGLYTRCTVVHIPLSVNHKRTHLTWC